MSVISAYSLKPWNPPLSLLIRGHMFWNQNLKSHDTIISSSSSSNNFYCVVPLNCIYLGSMQLYNIMPCFFLLHHKNKKSELLKWTFWLHHYSNKLWFEIPYWKSVSKCVILSFFSEMSRALHREEKVLRHEARRVSISDLPPSLSLSWNETFLSPAKNMLIEEPSV